jgi:hypothetical protein
MDFSPREDPRFTYGLIYDVFTVLEEHGYSRPSDENESNRATGAALVALLQLVREFEGRP